MLSSKKIISIVPARVGSKGLPNKNFMNFAGKPLYRHAVEQGLRVADKCILSTDHKNPPSLPESDFFVLHKRAPALASDCTSMSDVLVNVAEELNLNDETIVLLQPTSPLRTDKLVVAAIELFAHGRFEVVMGVTEIHSSILKSGFLSNGLFKPISDPKYVFSNRQELPPLFKPNGMVFVFNAGWIKTNKGLYSEKIGAIKCARSVSLDIDSHEDFLSAERVFCERSGLLIG